MSAEPKGLIAGIVDAFMGRNLSVLLVLAALGAGAVSLAFTPREEEPQIVVPLADVFVNMPGHDAREVEEFVSSRLEKLLYQIDGVEYVYSASRRDQAVITVRFYVGEDREDSLVRLYNKISMNLDRVPAGVSDWVIKPVEIDDVPVVCATLCGEGKTAYELRRLAEELESRVQAVPDAGRTYVIGGCRRQLNVHLLPEKLASRRMGIAAVERALRATNVQLPAGSFDRDDREAAVCAGGLLRSAADAEELVVGVHAGRPVRLGEVARVTDGSAEVSSYTFIGFGPAAGQRAIPPELRALPEDIPAVTLAVAKKKGANAVTVSREVQERLAELESTVLPDGVRLIITRDYGETAHDKVNSLVESLVVAMLIVVALIAVTMGWREALVVALAVPISFSLSLLVNYVTGYTINRVTLFALILALGMVVDDPITNVDNIQRHIRMRVLPPYQATIAAVQEVLPPVILSTLAIVASFSPMFFITGMMGPYMGPMAINVPLTVCFSTICALTFVPWLAHKLLARKRPEPAAADAGAAKDVTPAWIRRAYSWAVMPFLQSRAKRWLLVLVTLLLFLGSGALAVLGFVPLKMLPYDNKNEFQIVVDMPEGTSLERTAAVASEIGRFLRTVPEVTDYTAHVGLSSAMDFNGMVRHYYLRRGGHVADLRVNLVHRDRRRAQSHALALRIRKDLERLAERNGASLKIVESPPGPPVLSTIAAEVYGGPYHSYDDLTAAAGRVRSVMEREPGVVDVDDTTEHPKDLYEFVPDAEKAALNGVTVTDIARAVGVALDGGEAGTLHLTDQANPVPIVLRLPREVRSGTQPLADVRVPDAGGEMIRLSELGSFRKRREDQTIYRKNLRRVVYVTAESAGRPPAEAILSMQKAVDGDPALEGIEVDWAGEGEWKITLDVFRDLGIAFAVACAVIYILLVYETRSYLLPLVLMVAIPLTVIGIMPGFWLLNALTAGEVGGFPDPVFFTATAMIGMIGLSGIVVRNSVVLIQFIRDAVGRGQPLREAILASGAVRMRPILLTAVTTAVAAWPITLDPIFSGLAWSLIFGLAVSTAFSLVMVPVTYFMIYGGGQKAIR